MAASRTAPVIAFSTAVVAAVAAVVVSVIPFGTSGAAEPTSAFIAQRDLDGVAFTVAAAPALRYTGSLTAAANNGELTIEFEDLMVTSALGATGLVRINGVDGQYRQIDNISVARGPAELWESILIDNDTDRIDVDSVGESWGVLWNTAMPSLGLQLSPKVIAGRIGNTEQSNPPELGVELPAPNKGLPDARFQPLSDPEITSPEEGKVVAGEWETTYDPESMAISHIKGSYVESGYSYSLDAAVSTVEEGQLEALFGSIRSVIPDLTEVPAPGVPVDLDPVGWDPQGCTATTCTFDLTISGDIAPNFGPPGLRGFVNYGVDAQYARDDGPFGAIGGRCQEAGRVDFGDTGTLTCTARNLPDETFEIRISGDYEYLPFVVYSETNLANRLELAEDLARDPIELVRTGVKRPEAAAYGWDQNFIPSSYAVKKSSGDNVYLFDGVSPVGSPVVTLAPGYADHVTAGRFDSSWAGTETLRRQIGEQVAATSGDDPAIVWWIAEPSVTPAVEQLIDEAGYEDRFIVIHQPAN